MHLAVMLSAHYPGIMSLRNALSQNEGSSILSGEIPLENLDFRHKTTLLPSECFPNDNGPSSSYSPQS